MNIATAKPIDAIALQVQWTRLQSIADEGNLTIVRAALSPIVTESKDCSCVIVGATGDLIIGGGTIEFHYGAAAHSVRAVLATHGDSIADGDIFFGNDPYSGVAIHPSDVVIMKPVFVAGSLAAWVVNSAHMIDLGGMQFGSYSPTATDCFQESIKMPPVRLARCGVEQHDVWNILRNNIRLPDLVETDLRALMAGCHVAGHKLHQLIIATGGLAHFNAGVDQMNQIVTVELRQRLSTIEPGEYSYSGGTDWEPDYYPVPCVLTIGGEKLVFDFSGVASQVPHFINTRPYIVLSTLLPHIRNILARDLPLTQAVFDLVEITCPAGSLLNANKPAPIAFSNGDAAQTSAIVAVGCLQLALGASDRQPSDIYSYGELPFSAFSTWHFQGLDGQFDGCALTDGTTMGGPARASFDGIDGTQGALGEHGLLETVDVEIFESWYPLLIEERRVRPGAGGAGRSRAGAGSQTRFRPYGTDRITGTMLGQRQNLPSLGVFGGFPGDRTGIYIEHHDGVIEEISCVADGVILTPADTLILKVGNGGGVGDPLEREPSAVAADVAAFRLTEAEATQVYAVIVQDGSADVAQTMVARQAALRKRLADAQPAEKPMPADSIGSGESRPHFHGVVQRGNVTFSERSGAPLSRSPDPWTKGCPVLVACHSTRLGRDGVFRAYLDPLTGHVLYAEDVLEGSDVTVKVRPGRWIASAQA